MYKLNHAPGVFWGDSRLQSKGNFMLSIHFLYSLFSFCAGFIQFLNRTDSFFVIFLIDFPTLSHRWNTVVLQSPRMILNYESAFHQNLCENIPLLSSRKDNGTISHTNHTKAPITSSNHTKSNTPTTKKPYYERKTIKSLIKRVMIDVLKLIELAVVLCFLVGCFVLVGTCLYKVYNFSASLTAFHDRGNSHLPIINQNSDSRGNYAALQSSY